MKKTNIKTLLKDIFCMLAAVPVGAAASAVQLLGRKSTGGHSVGFLGGYVYGYNAIAYTAGCLLFLTYFVFAIRFLTSKKRFPAHRDMIPPFWVMYFGAALLTAFLTLFAESVVLIGMLGFTEDMSPESALYITLFGFPVLVLVGMVTAGVLCIRRMKEPVR